MGGTARSKPFGKTLVKLYIYVKLFNELVSIGQVRSGQFRFIFVGLDLQSLFFTQNQDIQIDVK